MKNFIIFILSFLISTSLLANTYYPVSQPFLTRSADVILSDTSSDCKQYNICNHTYKCNSGEWLSSYINTSGYRTGFSCRSCPDGYDRSSLTLSDGTAFDDACQRPCEDGYKFLNGLCQSCPEVYKEWRIDNPELGLQCLTKKCGSDQSLDSVTGQCIDFDPKCSLRSLDTIYPLDGSKPFCSSFCRKDPKLYKIGTIMQYRSSDSSDSNYYKCHDYPTCPPNHKLKIKENYVKTTLYETVNCEQQCLPDENQINGKCYKKCDKTEQFIDGKCVDTDPIVESINRLKISVSDSFNTISNNLESSFTDLRDLFSNVNDNVDQLSLKLDQTNENSGSESNSNIDSSSLNIPVPVYTFNLPDYLSIDKFHNNPQCPKDRFIEIWSTQYTFKYSLFCNSLEIIGKIILVIAFICAFKIIRSDD